MSNITTRNGFLPTTFTEAKSFAGELANSNLVPKAYAGKPLDILVAIQWGNEIGLAPMQALQNISVINGKPSVYGDAAMALVQAHPACEGVEEFFENDGTPNPVAVCIVHRKGRKPVTYRFSVEDAKRANLWGKQGPWSQYPKRMLQMRARGFALRDAFPDALRGLITTEEAQDYPEEAKPATIDITPKNPLDAIAAPPAIEETYEPIPAEVVSDTVETVEATDVVEVETVEPAKPSGTWLLYIPGKPEKELPSVEQWLVEYNAIADKTAGAGRASPVARKAKLRELREANDPTIKRLDSMVRIVLTQGHQTRMTWLDEQIREETGKPDNIRSDNGPQRQA